MITERVISDVIEISEKAGNEILNVYNRDIDVQYKDDKSPITEADRISHHIILEGLKKINTNVPVLSEEGKDIPYEKRMNWEYFWLVDPLDGTKEFIKKNGEFTVNIALIHRQKPVFGVVYAPALNKLYYGGKDFGGYMVEKGEKVKLEGNPLNRDKLVVVASRSHINEETKEFIESLKRFYRDIETTSIGSSLKICLLAEGKADIYPRIGPTMEWDTAAAHAVLNSVGGRIVVYNNQKTLRELEESDELIYNKKNLLNPYFVAYRSL